MLKRIEKISWLQKVVEEVLGRVNENKYLTPF